MGYSTLKAALDAVVKTNGRQEITGSNLNGVMTSILQGVDILDRANPADTSGLNHVVLKKNLTFAEQVTGTNTIYEIRDSFNLGGGSVVIPDGCLLKFNGGKLTNGGLSGNKFLVDSDSCCFSGITFLSDYVGVIHSRWFVHTDKLSKQNALVDCSTYLQDWVNCGSRNLYLDAGLYYVGSTITINRKVCIDGDGNMLTPRQEWPENYWDQSAIIFTDQEIPVVNFVIGNDGYKAFNIKNVGFANINKTPSVDTIPILKFDLTNAGLWGLDFSPCIYGSVDGSTFNHIGYQFNVYGTTFFALCHYGGKLDKLNIGYEFNKDAGATGFNNVSTFDVTATNVNMLINAPDFLNYATIRGMMQMNVNNNTFNNNKAFCEINGPVVWEADAADYGGSGTTWTARYLVRASRKITYKNAPAYAFVRNDGAPVYYNDAGDGDKSVNVIQTNSLLYLLKLASQGTSVISMSMTRGGVDVTSKFEQWQVLDAAGSHSLDTPLGANLAAGTDTTFDVTIKSTQRNSFLNVVLFINSKNYTNKRITINYCKSNGDVLDTISIAGTSDTILLPTFAKLPTNTSYVTITYHVDTYKSSSATFFIPSIGIDNGDTINNFESDSFNTPKMDKCAMLVFPNDSNDAVYEQFNIRKRGKFGGNDDGGSFVYLCTQRYHYSVYTSNSFRVLLNADGKEIRFDMACGGQGNNPVVNVYGDSHDVPFDVAVVKNTTSADNPFVEFDVFVKRTKRYMPFVIVESFQNYRYSEIGEVYIKATAPTLSDPATAFYRKSIGTMGATTDRPAYPVNGYEYYDTDLKKKILWNGSAWVNMDGTALA